MKNVSFPEVLRTAGRHGIEVMLSYRSERTSVVFFCGIFSLMLIQFFVANEALRYWLSYVVFLTCAASYMLDLAVMRWRGQLLRFIFHAKRTHECP